MIINPSSHAHTILIRAASEADGVKPKDFVTSDAYSTPLPSYYIALNKLTRAGLLEREGGTYRITPKGQEVLKQLPSADE